MEIRQIPQGMTGFWQESGAGDGNRTNTIGQNKALLPVFQFNWSQLESIHQVSPKGYGGDQGEAMLNSYQILGSIEDLIFCRVCAPEMEKVFRQ